MTEASTNQGFDPEGTNQISDWWASLSAAAQRRLRQSPHDPVPEYLAQEIVRSALLTTGTYWPTTYPANYNQFHIPQEVARWILDFGT